jgi:GTP cyclohydrolase I
MKFKSIPAGGSGSMPDVAAVKLAKEAGVLDWVGMSEIEVPLHIQMRSGVMAHSVAKAQAYVNLTDPGAKGIHMSRLYLLLDEVCTQTLTVKSLHHLLNRFLESHEGLSDRAFVDFRFEFLARRPSLKSEYSGWKAYPSRLTATQNGDEVTVEIRCDIPYSSTCPCSAALARQLIQQEFIQKFGSDGEVAAAQVHAWLGTEQGIVATPHSQRSIAQVRVELAGDLPFFPLEDLIDLVEGVLKTPVQTAVKREDEQEFARLNGQNLMFCEDAARRIQSALAQQTAFQDFWIRVNHLESLHAHNAVSIVTKGIPGGYLPQP